MRLMPAAAIVFTLACAARSGTQTRTPAKSSPAPAAPPPAARAERTESDEYTRYELLDPETAQFHILYEATAIAPGATVFFNPIRKGSEASGERVTDRMSGEALRFEVVSGEEARRAGLPGADLDSDYTESRHGVDKYVNVVRKGSRASKPSARILDTGEKLAVETLRGEEIPRTAVDIGEPVQPDSEAVVIRFPAVEKGHSVRLRISETYTDEKSYRLDGDELVFDRSFGRPHNAVVLPAGWYLTACAIPVAVSQMPDGRIRLDFVNPRPDEIAVLIKARRRPSSPSPGVGMREGSPLALLSAGRDRRSRPLAKRAAGRAG
jgi:hypothetical protein